MAVKATDATGKTALIYAVQQSNNESVVRALIDAGADVNATDNKGKTALLYSVQQSNNESVVRALIGAGADVNITDNEGKTALFYTVEQSNNESVVRALIEADADLNICDIESKTSLVHAVQNNNEGAAVALIKAGANVNKKDKMLRTCLIYAVLNENERLTKALIEASADVNATDLNLKNALTHAVCSGTDVLVRVLIQAGANLNIVDIGKKTALIRAIENNNVSAAIALIEAGADLNMRDKWMKTALVHAVLNDNEQLVNALIARGADVNALDSNKTSALNHAIIKKSEKIAFELIGAGADVNLADGNSKTPLIYTAENFCFSLVGSDGHEHETEDENRAASIKAFAKNFQEFISLCFELPRKLPEEVWLSSVNDEIKSNEGDTMDAPSYELWFQAYRNVRSYSHEWERVLFHVIEDDKQVVENLVDQCSGLILSELDIKDAITCTAKLEHDIIAQGGSSSSNREKKGKVWIEDFITRITTSERKPDLINSLIKAGADVNQTDIDGKSALIHALQMGRQYVANTLIHQGTEVNTFDKSGRTALIYAVKNNEPRDMVQLLINHGSDINRTDNKDKTSLIYAILNDNDSLAKTLIEAGADVNTADASFKTALMYAVENEKEWLTRKLIEKGADVNLTDKKCRTSLIYTAQNETQILARVLIDAGSSVNATDSEYKTALIHAVQNKNNRLATFLISKGAAINLTDNEWKTALVHAVKSNEDFQLVETLIKAGSDVNAIDREEKTALIYAVQNENRTLTSALIDAGTDVNVTDKEDATALIYSIQNKNEFLAETLIQAGTEINLADSKKKTPLIYAVQHQLEELTVKLLDAGANVHDTDEEGKTALFYAVQSEFLVSTLIKAGADANVKDNQYKTPLFYALQNESVVRQLVEEGNCGVKSRDVYGRTPLCYALTKSLSSSRFLLGKGENIDSQDFCSLSNLSFFLDYFLLRKIDKHYLVDGLKFFSEQKVSSRTVFKTIINAVFSRIISSHSVLKPTFDVLMVAREYVADDKESNILRILAQIQVESSDQKCLWESQVPNILSLLMELGANPNSVDSDGNTALHYVAYLPFMGVSRETVKKICSLLRDFGVLFNIKNCKGETPLLFCLKREVDLMKTQKQKNMIVDVEGLLDVWTFLLEHGASVDETNEEGQSALHLILNLFDQGLRSVKDKEKEKEKGRNILNEALGFFDLFAAGKMTRGITVNIRASDLNSPLHLWASLRLKPGQEYDNVIWKSIEIEVSEDGYEVMLLNTLDFKNILVKIFQKLLEGGAQLNDRNAKLETPLHLSRTWTAVQLLLDAGANPNDIDEAGRPPLLAAAKRNKFGQGSTFFYPDVLVEPKTFWITALERGLNPWSLDKNGESVFSILISSEAFVLVQALLEVAIEKSYIKSDTIARSLLHAICKDNSTRAQWKSILVERILKSRSLPAAVANVEDTPLHYCCRNIVRSPDEPSVHWTLAKLLLSSGADPGIPNKAGETCLDIASSHRGLRELLVKPIDIYEVPLLIPWLSVSKRYEPILAKTARRQMCRHIEPYWCHKYPLASGYFGLVFAGINEKDGREVAIKRIEKERTKDKTEIKHLTALADCEQVVRYLSFFEDEHFRYVVLELMEGNLDDYLDSDYSEPEALRLCKDVVKGLKFLHGHDILHRDLKPSNILYRRHPKPCLKIADFGLSRRIADITGSSSVYAGTKCWIAPEVLKSATGHSKSSDIFACGLVLHYTLSGKRHPFVPTDCENKSPLEIKNKTERNIIEGNDEGWDDYLSPEAAHLIGQLLQKEEKERPTAKVALAHTLFWTEKKKMDLLTAVGNQPEFECPRAKRTPPLTAVETKLENSFGTIVKHVKWNDPGYVHMPAIYSEMMMKRKLPYDPFSTVELVRFIRNAIVHVSGSTRPTPRKKMLLEDFIFLKYFPNLVCEVHKAVTIDGWDQTREEIKYILRK